MAGMLVGYGRTSSAAQCAGLEAQERDLKAAGVEKMFLEQVSSVAKDGVRAVMEGLDQVSPRHNGRGAPMSKLNGSKAPCSAVTSGRPRSTLLPDLAAA